EVFLWGGEDRIVKIAKPHTSAAAMRTEFRNTRIVWENGLPAPQPYEEMEIDGRPAIVSERIRGVSLMEQFVRDLSAASQEEAGQAQPPAFGILHATAEVLAEVHRMGELPLPSQQNWLREAILGAPYLSGSEKEAVIHHMALLPERRQVCHGDPNPNNIFILDGRTMMLDWMNASIGNQEADLAEYIMMVRYAILPPELPQAAVRMFDAMREQVIAAFCTIFAQLTGIGYSDVEPWLLPIAARKLNASGIVDEEKLLLLQYIRERL